MHGGVLQHTLTEARTELADSLSLCWLLCCCWSCRRARDWVLAVKQIQGRPCWAGGTASATAPLATTHHTTSTRAERCWRLQPVAGGDTRSADVSPQPVMQAGFGVSVCFAAAWLRLCRADGATSPEFLSTAGVSVNCTFTVS